MKTVWIFDGNRRVYPKAPAGKLWASEGPIYREHWVEHEVVSENRRSWITKYGAKVPKTGGRGIAFSVQEVDDDVWLNDHRSKIERQVGDIKDPALLRKVAELIDYKAIETQLATKQ